jgi:hypothetical protein
MIDTFGIQRAGDSPFLLWQLRTEERLLDTAAVANREQQRTAVHYGAASRPTDRFQDSRSVGQASSQTHPMRRRHPHCQASVGPDNTTRQHSRSVQRHERLRVTAAP